MKILLFLLFSFLGITVVSSIIVTGGRGGFHSNSKSSEEGYGGGHGGHGHHHDHGRPPPASKRCEPGWMTFNRQQGKWCVKVFYGFYAQNAAENLCKAQGATLTGLQDASERIQIANAARVLNNQNGNDFSTSITVILGSRRKAQCPNLSACRPNDAFEWTDGHTTGNSGYFFPPGEPNALFVNGMGIQTCLHMFILVSESAPPRGRFRDGDLDDLHCVTPTKMYACGKIEN